MPVSRDSRGRAKLAEPLHRARALLSIGDIPAVHQALEEFETLMRTERMTKDPFTGAGWVISMEALRREGLPEQAIARGSRWALKARKLGWKSVLAQLLTAMGFCALDLSDLDRGLRWFEEAKEAAQQAGDSVAAAAAGVGEARAWEIRGEDDRCLELARTAQADARSARDGLTLARALNVEARVLIRRGRDGAEALLEEAEQLCVDAGAHAERIEVLLDRLPLAFAAGDLTTAKVLLDRAAVEADLIGGTELRGRVALDRGELFRMQGQTSQARAQYRQALDILPAGRPLVRIAKLNLALADLEEGDRENVVAGLDGLLSATRGNRFLTGVTHLIALAAGPVDKQDEEDAVWARHGTPARLALASSRIDADLAEVAEKAAYRMARGADRVQAGRAALVMGLQEVTKPDLVRTLRHANAALPIGPYLTIHRLGIGGMGQVWLARHVDRDRPAAVKVLNPDQQGSAFAWDSLHTELRAVSALSHPNIVSLLDHGRVGFAASALSSDRIQRDSPYLALEYVPGGVLTPWVGKLSWAGVRNVLDDLLNALAHAHAHQVLHLDLKPDNILLVDRTDPLAGVKLVDFGLALFRKDSRDIFAGTPQFMAPEQVQKAKEYGPWTDLYALGCLAWAMTTGAAPFDHPDRNEMARLHARVPPPPFRPCIEVPPGFEAWVQRLLQKKIEDRLDRASDARALLLALDDAPPREVRPRSATALPDAGLALVQELEPELVGRDAERAQLWAAFEQAVAGPTVVEISGPLGSGRRALMAWLASQTHERGVAEVLVHVAETGFEALVGPQDTAEHTAAAVLERFERRRRQRTAVLLLDGDDPAVPAVLEALRKAPIRLLLVVRGYPGTVPGDVLRLPLQPLGSDVMARVLAGVLPLAKGLEGALKSWARGNPGLAVRTLRDLGAQGELRPTLHGWDVPHPRPFHVPDGLKRLLVPQLTLEDPGHNEALEVAAALGTRFEALRWQQLAPAARDVARLLSGVAILGVSDGRHFDECTVEWIQPAARHLVADRPATRLAHARIAEELQQEGAPAKDVALHYLEARRYADAHRPLLDAVKQAIADGDPDEARRFHGLWEDALTRLAVSAADPRRLAGERLKARLG